MALAQIYSAIAGDTITAARWNNEFGNIYSNGTSVAFPVTMAVSFAGYTLTLDAAGVTTLASPTNTGFLFTIGSKSGAPGTNGCLATFAASTFTDSSTAALGTATLYTGLSVRTPTLAASNAGVTTTQAATVYVEGAPIAGANETITNPYAVYVDSGKVQLDGDLQVEGNVTFNGTLNASSADPYLLTNLKLVATMSGSAMTVALKTDAGTDPTASDKVKVRFRNATLSTGGTTQVSISSALSIVVSSGSTLGTVSGQRNRIYIGLLNNAGTAELFVYNPLSGNNLKGLLESSLLSTTTEGGAGTADSAQVAYSTVGRSNLAFRIIGVVESVQATAGTWTATASVVQELQPWMPRTGAIIGSAIVTNGVSSGALTTTFALDDTPSITAGGTSVVSVSYTPSNAANLIEIEAKVAAITLQGDTAPLVSIIALFTDLSASAIWSDTPLSMVVANTVARGSVNFKMRAAGFGAMTSASIRAGGSNATSTNNHAFNTASTANDEGATMNSYISVTEIMV